MVTQTFIIDFEEIRDLAVVYQHYLSEMRFPLMVEAELAQGERVRLRVNLPDGTGVSFAGRVVAIGPGGEGFILSLPSNEETRWLVEHAEETTSRVRRMMATAAETAEPEAAIPAEASAPASWSYQAPQRFDSPPAASLANHAVPYVESREALPAGPAALLVGSGEAAATGPFALEVESPEALPTGPVALEEGESGTQPLSAALDSYDVRPELGEQAQASSLEMADEAVPVLWEVEEAEPVLGEGGETAVGFVDSFAPPAGRQPISMGSDDGWEVASDDTLRRYEHELFADPGSAAEIAMEEPTTVTRIPAGLRDSKSGAAHELEPELGGETSEPSSAVPSFVEAEVDQGRTAVLPGLQAVLRESAGLGLDAGEENGTLMLPGLAAAPEPKPTKVAETLAACADPMTPLDRIPKLLSALTAGELLELLQTRRLRPLIAGFAQRLLEERQKS